MKLVLGIILLNIVIWQPLHGEAFSSAIASTLAPLILEAADNSSSETSTDILKNRQLMYMYPNPIQKEVIIQVDVITEQQPVIELYNLKGKLVDYVMLQGVITTWDTHHLLPGIYFAVLRQVVAKEIITEICGADGECSNQYLPYGEMIPEQIIKLVKYR